MARGDVDRDVVRHRDVREVDGVGPQRVRRGGVEESGLARDSGRRAGGLVGGRIDGERPAPAGVAGEVVAVACEAQPVEIDVALDIDQDLGIAAGDMDVVEHHVADRMGHVIGQRIPPVDLDRGVGIGVGRHRIGAAGDGHVLDHRGASEAEQDDVAVAVLAAVAVLLEGRVEDVDPVDRRRAAAGADAVDRVAGEVRILDQQAVKDRG